MAVVIQVDVRAATHVKVGGTFVKIRAKWGIDADGRLAKPSEGGFGVITEDGRHVTMWEAEGYGKEVMPDEPLFLVWSLEHRAWWKPAKWGYTESLAEAGRYTREEAEDIVDHANVITVNECAIPVEAVMPSSAEPRLAPYLSYETTLSPDEHAVLQALSDEQKLAVAHSLRVLATSHDHCECRRASCGHLDIRHEDGACSFPGCLCKEWA